MNNLKNTKVCFLDTEFNAFDYNGQNDGYQEITEIGAVVFQNGKAIARFSRYCLLKKGHYLTKRCKKITGITPKVINREGVPFNQAMNELNGFLVKNKVKVVYAFGPSDSMEMRRTARLNKSNQNVVETIKSIKNVYPIFRNGLSLHYAFSLFDICRICNVEHGEDRAHSALYDAEDTGLALYNMRANNINKQVLDEINTHKYNIKLYRKARSVNNATVKVIPEVNTDFMETLNKVFDNAEERIGNPIKLALHDDMMRVIGRPDLEIGEEGL